MTAPNGRTYSVRRQWLGWRQRIPFDPELVVFVPAVVELGLRAAIAPPSIALRRFGVLRWELEVRDHGRRWWSRSSVVRRERIRGWDPSQRRLEELARDVERGHVALTGFPVTVHLPPSGDGSDDSRTYMLDEETSPPTVSTLVEALRAEPARAHAPGGPTT
ncbi:hypothetical protein [Nocardioides hwasunensis]|uniref:Uncharacterized protein n=1 Tax=Nocardioides hwasunensis TaxID=397258 RepID=A0ABR8MCN9_9ACTN|nr:hypothetical protein [Nocardioides hwasunensis]MBD3913712.1 hypothetical protein [Nocardioides hwasunensis]